MRDVQPAHQTGEDLGASGCKAVFMAAAMQPAEMAQRCTYYIVVFSAFSLALFSSFSVCNQSIATTS